MTRAGFHALLKEQKGAALVEMAMALPVVILFILGTLQIGLTMQANSALRDAVGWAGREAMVSYQDTSDGVYSSDTIKNMIISKSADKGHKLKSNKLTVNVSITDDNVLLAKKIAMSTSYNVDMVIPLWKTKTITINHNRTFYVPKA